LSSAESGPIGASYRIHWRDQLVVRAATTHFIVVEEKTARRKETRVTRLISAGAISLILGAYAIAIGALL
jgi:hypothetical protein